MPRKILLADDSITIQKVVELAFRDAGFEVVSVADGASAIRRLQEMVPDVVLADVLMPQQTGYDVCQFVKTNPATAHVPVLLLRGTFEPWDPSRAAQVRADGSVIKPFESDRLVQQVLEILASAPAPGTVSVGPPAEAMPEGIEAGLLDETPAAAPAGFNTPVIPLSAAPVGESGLVSPSDWLADNPPPAEAPAAAPADPFAAASPAPPAFGGAGFGESTEAGVSFDLSGGAGEGPTPPAPLWETPPEAPAPPPLGGVAEFGVEPVEPAAAVPDFGAAPRPAPEPGVDYRTPPPILEDPMRFETGIRDEPLEAAPPAASAGAAEALPEEARRALVEEIVGRLSDQVIRELAARIVPDVAERIIRAKVEEIEKKVEGA